MAQGVCAMLMTFTSFPDLVTFIGFTLTIFTALAVGSVFLFRRRPGWRPLGGVSVAYPLIPALYCLLGVGTTIYGLIWQPKASIAALAVIGAGAVVYRLTLQPRGAQ
jgi:APA family basic amino acid/polyamine antiporter